MEIDLGNLENLQEELVVRALEIALQDNREDSPEAFCACKGCVVDIVALALNSLPPRYVADKYYKFPETPEGAAKAQETAERALRMAIRKVARRPHHDR